MIIARLTDGRTNLWQYDTGVKVVFLGTTSLTECHFPTPSGLVCRSVIDNICEVPDEALLDYGILEFYAFEQTQEHGITRHEVRFDVHKRPKPTGYVDPPDEYDNLEEQAKRVAPLIPGDGSVSADELKAAVDQYMEENPLEIAEVDPNVPDWAKQTDPPKYSADDVGALPVDAIKASASGAVVSVTDAAARPAVGLVSQIVAVQDGEGDPSPDNIRPIVGWNRVGVTRTGKNLFDVSKVVSNSRITNNGDGSITVSTTSTSAGAPAGGIPTLETYAPGLIVGQTYTLSALTTGTDKRIYLSLASKTWNFGSALTMTEDILKSNVIWYASGGATTATISDIQIELGDTATPYEPYTGQTLTANLPETVYGGNLDWVTGVLTVTHEGKVFTGEESFSVRDANAANMYFSYQGLGPYGYIVNDRGMSTHLPIAVVSSSNTTAGIRVINFNGGNAGLVIRPGIDGITTVKQFQDYLAAQYAAGTPLTVVYELAQPYTIQFTPQELALLHGANTIWSDCGNTDLVYVADLQLYIDQRIAAIAAASIGQ